MIEEWMPNNPRSEQDFRELAGVLHDAVHAGASVNFILPFSLDDAGAFWVGKVLPGVIKRTRIVLIARAEGEIVGTVQMNLDMPPNQMHRADVAKLLVHPKARRRGIARALMAALEPIARREGRTLLTLDTRTGDLAESLYRRMGYVPVGVIPRFSRAVDGPELEAATLFYKELE